MEKLQAALATARQARSENRHERKNASASVRPRPNKVGSPASLWEGIEEIQPHAQTLREYRVVSRTASKEATPFDILRTKMLLQMRQNGWTRLAITSPLPSCGKTTVSSNLALGLGRQKELRSILFDLDIRDPSIAEFFHQRPEMTISQLLQGEVSFADQARRIGDNLAISMAGPAESDPTRIMLAEKTVDVIDEIQENYKPDLMIFDLPSVLVNDDTRAFLKNVDCALIVARADSTSFSQFDNCEREISEHTNVLGVVLNACRHGYDGYDGEV